MGIDIIESRSVVEDHKKINGRRGSRGRIGSLARFFSRLRLRDQFAIVAFFALAVVELYFAYYFRSTLAEMDAPEESIRDLFWMMMEVRILLGLLFYLLLTVVVDVASGNMEKQRRQLVRANDELLGATRELEKLNDMYKTQSELLRTGMEKLSRRNKDLSNIHEVMHFLSEKVELEDLLDEAPPFLALRLGLDALCLYLWDQAEEKFMARAVYGLPKDLVGKYMLDRKQSLEGNVIMSGRLRLEGDLKPEALFPGVEQDLDRSFQSMAAFPMKLEDRIIGVFTGLRRDRFAFDPEDIDTLEAIITELCFSLQNAFLVQTLRINALTDSLTGLYNHGYFQMRLREELAKSRRYGRVFTLLMIDLDHFKDVNDSYGHPVGDKVLVAVARFLIMALRKSDIIARYGGEEIAVILTETGKWDSLGVAERLRKGIGQLQIPVKEAEWPEFKARAGKPDQGPEHERLEGYVGITASFGLAGFPVDSENATDLLLASDNALYKAKQSGRNRVVMAGEDVDESGQPAPKAEN